MPENGQTILCLNSGSSSLKFSLYEIGAGWETRLAVGAVERFGLAGSRVWIETCERETRDVVEVDICSHDAAVQFMLDRLRICRFPRPAAIGHRVVHGGQTYARPRVIDESLKQALSGLRSFAPLHLPGAIKVIGAVSKHYPEVPQVACFDTAFHRGIPELAQRLPLPRDLWDEGVRQYGFHGLSYESVVDQIGDAAQRPTIIAHLGNGSSLAAVRNGRSVDTTMGFTPTAGLMMGTRTGDMDPGVLLYLMRHKGYDVDRLQRLVDQESGLLGVSGQTSDMERLLQCCGQDKRAKEAVELFCYIVRKHIGALTAVLGGLETLVFTGGIGQCAAPVRAEICASLGYLGIQLDNDLNRAHADTISRVGSHCVVRVISTNEDLVIARHTVRLLYGGPD